MKTTEKLYLTANELSEMLGVSTSVAYKLIREMNQELRDKNYITISGKVPRKYFETKYFGYGA